ncbi:MAG: prephenate dehydrogenase/arogenate dehydrogenase family protein [Anaerolineae bacterium]|nr:prephenate dehydrogenase/arogenate dehydrogenase family protein [Anaerolineae bacterium]
MSKPKPQITIVGLGMIGGSMGLALRQAGAALAVIGHDIDTGIANQARKLEMVDKVEWNLISACEKANLIILATPVAAIELTLKAIAPYLRPGCVVIDTATLKAPVLAWAEAILPKEVHFVGTDPIVVGQPSPATQSGQAAEKARATGLEAARADLFKDALFCLVPAQDADPSAVKLAADLAAILGAKPFFLDATEHDSLLAAVDHLPAITALALLEMATGQASWKEMRKVAGLPFELATHMASTDPSSYGDLAVANRDNMLRWIDALSASLASLRQELAEGTQEALAERFAKAVAERDRWLSDRATRQLLEIPHGGQMPSRGDLFDAFLGSGLRKALTGERGAPKREKGK